MRQVQADAALTPVWVLHEHVALLVHRQPLQHDDPALGVAAHGVLDLEHVGAPVRQHCAGRGGEGELGNLQNAKRPS